MARAAPSLRARALRLLAAREHSRAELKRKLSGGEPRAQTEPGAETESGTQTQPGTQTEAGAQTEVGVQTEAGAQAEAGAETELDALLDEFERKGWLSEGRLAEQMVQAARGRYGSRRVLDRLRQKGVTEAALDSAALALRQQDLESARALWRKRFDHPPTDLRERARQTRFLAGRGFSSEVIRDVLGGEPDESE